MLDLPQTQHVPSFSGRTKKHGMFSQLRVFCAKRICDRFCFRSKRKTHFFLGEAKDGETRFCFSVLPKDPNEHVFEPGGKAFSKHS